MYLFEFKSEVGPSQGGSLGWRMVPSPKSCRFDSWSGHV